MKDSVQSKKLIPPNHNTRFPAGRIRLGVTTLIATSFVALSAQAVTPPPGGGYPNDNTALGDDALFSLTTGANNTALGFNALYSLTTGLGNTATGNIALYSVSTGKANTANGSQALRDNNGDFNTAIGSAALSDNTAGYSNTASGALALTANTTGYFNTADGASALLASTTGYENTASGYDALGRNGSGSFNTAAGAFALSSNTTGTRNTATGTQALVSNITGNRNTADGYESLFSNTIGNHNAAFGWTALFNNRSGSRNIALGDGAGFDLTTGDSNIDIGNPGVADEARTIRIGLQDTHEAAYIAGIAGVTVAEGIGVVIDASGRLGTITSSARYKEAIAPMGAKSETILALNPVTFRYKKDLDRAQIPQFGLVAEEVEKVSPDLVARDGKGRPYSVRYEAVNAMLLNEFLKEHRKVEKQDATIAALQSALVEEQREIKALATTVREQEARVRQVRAQLQTSQAPTRFVSTGEL